MTTAQVVETSVTLNKSTNRIYPDDQIPPVCEMTPELKPFTVP